MDDYQREIEVASSSSDADVAGVILGIVSSADRRAIENLLEEYYWQTEIRMGVL